MRKRTGLFVGMAVLLVAGTAQAAKASHAQVCTEMDQLQAKIQMAQNPSPQMTVGQYKNLGSDIQKSYHTFMKSAESVAKPEAKNLDNSIQTLKKSAQNLPNGATLQQAQSQLQPDIMQVRSAKDALVAKLNCPATAAPTP